MKIALILDDVITRAGGVQENILELYSYLSSKGHQVKIICGSDNGEPVHDKNIIQIGKNITIQDITKWSSSIPLTFGLDDRIKRILNKEKFDIIHIQAPFTPMLSGKILKYSKSINVATFLISHDSFFNRVLTKRLITFQKKSVEKIHGKIAISMIAAEYASFILDDDIREYRIVPLGINTNRFNPSVKKIPKFDDDKTNILFVNRLDSRKGLIYLIKAFRKLKEKRLSTRLIIVGDGPKREEVEDYISSHSLEDVYLEGYVDRKLIPNYFATADIFCSPATSGESFGRVLLEAMACAKPVVTFDIDGYREVMPRHSRSLMLPKKNINALATALHILIDNPDLRKKIGKINLKESKKYSWENVGKEILKFYEELMNKNN